MKTTELRVPAIQVHQGSKRTLYTFAVDGKLVDRFASVSRVRRDDAGISGYQRPEVLSHIAEIRNYLESDSPMVPNAVVIALDSSVKFHPTTKGKAVGYSRPGELVIPIPDAGSKHPLPGFVVDGQQRLAAIRESELKSFPICATAFITDDLKEQTEQFILVNSTKPLPKGLIYELLPNTEATLPTLLARRRLPAYLVGRLNHDEHSPLKGLIQTPTNPEGVMKDNSMLRMLENSLNDGLLYRLRSGNGPEETEPMLGAAYNFWGAVREVFTDSWALPPKRSRLMHGAGVVSLGFVMDAISERYRSDGFPSIKQFKQDLKPLKSVCRWTDGYWDFGPGQQRKWSDVQNTSKDVELLSNYLLLQYKALVWGKGGASRRQLSLTD
jgi:DGQHR domain-containing protein